MMLTKPVNIVVPMAGEGSRFRVAGYARPKPFIDVAGETMIQRVLEGIRLPAATYTLVVRAEFQHAYRQDLERLQERNANVYFSSVSSTTRGAVCSVLSAHRRINSELPLIICDADNIIDNELFKLFVDNAAEQGVDGSVAVIHSTDPAMSYARFGDNGLVVETKEKVCISDRAIAGFYYFKHGTFFVDSAIQMLIYGRHQLNEFFVSDCFNALISEGLTVSGFLLPQAKWKCLGTPSLLEKHVAALEGQPAQNEV